MTQAALGEDILGVSVNIPILDLCESRRYREDILGVAVNVPEFNPREFRIGWARYNI